MPGSRHDKRWQDVLDLLDEGINVISAVNVQHLESLNDVVERELGGRPGDVRSARAPAAVAPKTVDRLMVCLSSDPPLSRVLLRKASRIAGRLNTDWHCVYVQTPAERADRIDTAVQRRLVDNIQLAQSMGAEITKLEGDDVAVTLARFAAERGVTLAVVGATRRSRWYRFRRGSVVERLLEARSGLDVLVVSVADEAEPRGERRDAGLAAVGGDA